MRSGVSTLAVALLLFAGPAFAQTAGGQAGSDMHQGRHTGGSDRYQVTGPLQEQMRGSMQQRQMQSGSTTQQDQQGTTAQEQSPQTRQSDSGVVSFATRGKIKESLEQSGFKNVQVMPQAYLIRAQAPDGSRVVMQVSPEGLYGVVVNQPGSPREGSGGSMPQSGSTQDSR